MIDTKQTQLYAHDALRIEKLRDRINGGNVSFEGEPIYADKPWGEFHDLAYGTVIPGLVTPDSSSQRLDVLYDDYTTPSSTFSEGHFLNAISDRLSGGAEGSGLPIKTASEGDMADRAEEWIGILQGLGVTTDYDGILSIADDELHHPMGLVTRSGRPACPILDAVFQATKAEEGVTTTVLVHSTEFRLQQTGMLAILRKVHGGELPFDNFVNVFTRQRKGKLRLANVKITKSDGTSTEIN